MSRGFGLSCALIVFLVVGSLQESCRGAVVLPFAKFHVRIINGMSRGQAVKVHCKSKDDDLGLHTLAVGQTYQFGFRVNIAATTLFYCDMWHGPGDRSHVHFDAFKAYANFADDECEQRKNACVWWARDDGVRSTGRNPSSHPWPPTVLAPSPSQIH